MALIPISSGRRRKKRRTNLGRAIAGGVAAGLAGGVEARSRKAAGAKAAEEAEYKRQFEERKITTEQEREVQKSAFEREKFQATEGREAQKYGLDVRKQDYAEAKELRTREFDREKGEAERASLEKRANIRAEDGGSAERKPFAFEARTTRIRSALAAQDGQPLSFDQTPLRFAMMSIAKQMANEGKNPGHEGFYEELLGKIATQFPEEDRLDHGIIAEYMLRNSKELPWVDMDDETKKRVSAKSGGLWTNIQRFFLPRSKEIELGIAPAQTIEELIDERLK